MTHPDPYKLWIQLDAMKERLLALARENAELRAERDIALARVDSLLPRATPEQEEELLRMMAEPQYPFEDVIAEVERIVGSK